MNVEFQKGKEEIIIEDTQGKIEIEDGQGDKLDKEGSGKIQKSVD